MKYYKIEDDEIIVTRHKIPEEVLEKKGLLPVRFETIRLEEGTTKGVRNESVIEDGVYVVYNTKFFHVDTLEEAIDKKKKALRSYVQPKFPELFKQINALLGEYDATKTSDIKKTVKNMRKYIDLHEPIIDSLSTVEEVDDYEFRMEEDIPIPMTPEELEEMGL